MALGRIKNPEQLKQCKPGELGRLIGLDRVPEVRCLREKIKEISEQGKARQLNNLLIDQWYDDEGEDGGFLYIDGHQRIYYGSKAQLPAKYISRQKLCLSATTEFWVHDLQGMPVMMVMGELTEKLQTAIEDYVIPQLLQTTLLKHKEELDNHTKPQCTFIFDREAYDIPFFKRLWKVYQIAVITYRKNIKDKWDEKEFEIIDTQILNNDVTMYVCEKNITIEEYEFREIRRLGENGHQTPILTTHPTLAVSEAIEPERDVVNPPYRKLTNKIKKLREKISRIESKFYPLVEQAMDNDLDKLPQITARQAMYKEDIDHLRDQEAALMKQREQHPARIRLKDMPDNKRYDKLKTESKLFMNVIKMICYRAESAMADLASPYLKRSDEEKRMFIKQIIQNNADLLPDYENGTLTVVLHSLSAPRFNNAAQELAKLINDSQTIFPGTNLRLIFKTTADSNCEG